MAKEKERPLAVKLIVAYIIIYFIYVIFSMLAGYGWIGLGAIIMILALYNGLWKMQKAWMHVVVFLLALNTVFYLLFMAVLDYSYIDSWLALIETGVIILLNCLSIAWLMKNTKLFNDSEKDSKRGGGKKTSGAWYLLPIFFGLIGGVIGYFALKERDKKMAERILIVGIVTLLILMLTMIVAGILAGWATRYATEQRSLLEKCIESNIIIKQATYDASTETLSIMLYNPSGVSLEGFNITINYNANGPATPVIWVVDDVIEPNNFKTVSRIDINKNIEDVEVRSNECMGSYDLIRYYDIAGLEDLEVESLKTQSEQHCSTYCYGVEDSESYLMEFNETDESFTCYCYDGNDDLIEWSSFEWK